MPITNFIEVWKTKGLQKRIMRPVLKMQPDWYCLDGYFCLPNTTLFLCGFVLDHKPYASEVNIFSLPLFTNDLRFHLSYAEMLQGDNRTIQVRGRKPTLIADEFISKVTPLVDEALEKDSLDYFTNLIEEHELYGNTRICYDYGLALIMLNKFREAAHYLNIVASSEWELRVVPEEAKNAQYLVELLNTNHESAISQVNKYLHLNHEAISQYMGP